MVADILIFSFLTTDLSTQICCDLTELKRKAVRQEVKEATEIVKTWSKDLLEKLPIPLQSKDSMHCM